MENVIWQPSFTSLYDFQVYLDRDFAKKMTSTKITRQNQERFNQNVGNHLLKLLGENWLGPYQFHEDTCFVSQFSIGHNGVWLSTDYRQVQSITNENQSIDNIIYNSHNVNNSRDAYVLLSLFGKWVEYAKTLRELNNGK